MTESEVLISESAVSKLAEAPIRILHVDDDMGFLETAKQILEMQGAFEVETASSVEAAAEKMKTEKYDAVVCDYQMPGKNGLQFLKELREEGNPIPFVMFTGRGREEVAIDALNLGANGYFNKTGQPETVYGELAHGIRQTVEAKRASEALRESESKSRALLEHLPQKIFFKDKNSVYISCNENYARDLKVKSHEIAGKTDYDFYPKELAEKYRADDKRLMTSGNTEEIDEEYIQDGRKLFVHTVKTPVKDAKGNVVGVLGIFWDVTDRKRMVEQLEVSEEKYRRQFEEALDAIFVADAETGLVIDCNRAAAELVGRAKSEIVGKHQRILHPPEEIEGELSRTFKQHLEEKEGQILEAQVITKEGEIKDVEIKANVFELEGKKLIQGIFRDITELKKAEEERNKLLRDYGERVKELRCLYELARLVEKPNISLEEIMRGASSLLPSAYQYPDITCSRIVFDNREFTTGNFKETRWKQQATLRVHGEKAGVVEVYYLEEKPTIAEGPFLKEEGNLMDAFVERLGRIIERKKMEVAQARIETALMNSEAKFRSIFEGASDGMLILSKTGRILDVNSKTVELFGGSREELLDKRFTKIGIFSLRDIPKLSKNFAAILRGKKTFFSLYIKNKEGQTIFLECSASLTKIQGGNDVVVAVIRNVTERKKAEDAIRENQQKFERLFVGNPEAAVYVDSKFHILDANPRFEKLFRYSLDEIRDKHINNIVVPKDKTEEAEALDREAGKGHVYYDTVRMRKDGSLLPVSLSTAPIIVENQIFGHILMYKDISQLKQMEKELRDSEERLNTLFELAPDAYYLNDLRGNIVDGNRAAEELTGFRREELIGKNLLKLILLPRSQAMKAAKLLTMNTLGKATGPDELTLNRKDGTQVPVEIRTYPAKIKEKAVVLGIARDISERKNLEEKLRVVGGLTRHDVRNKLSTVTGNVYLLKRKLAGDPQALKQLNDMEAAVRLVEKIYEFARTYERLGVEELTSIDVGKAFDEAASLFSDYRGVKVVNECRGLTVLGDSLLRQLFFNLIDDSLKYGEKIRQIKVHYMTANMDQLELVYEDDGVGVPDDMRSHLFKEGVGKGTGYGLFMIKRICEVYGWTIQETGKHGKGARFTMTIPSSNSKGERLFKIHE